MSRGSKQGEPVAEPPAPDEATATERRRRIDDAARADDAPQAKQGEPAASPDGPQADTGEPAGSPDDPLADTGARRAEAGADAINPFGVPGRPLRRSPFVIGFTFALGAILAYVLYTALAAVWHVVILVVIAGFLAVGIHPAILRLERLGLKRGLALALVLVAVAGFFAAFGFAIVPPIVRQVTQFTNSLPDYVQQLRHNSTFQHLDERYGILKRLQNLLSEKTIANAGTTALGGIFGVGKFLASTVFNTLTVLILTLYFVSSFDRIKNGLYRLVPRARRPRVMLISDEVLTRIGGYVSGAFIIAVLAGISALIWLEVARVPYPLALALLVAIFDLIPLIGATLGAVVGTLVAFFVSWPIGVATLVYFIVYQQVENYVIYPRVMKRTVDISPAAAIVAALAGGSLLGLVGGLLAIPSTAAIQLVFREVVLPRQDAS